MFFFCFSSFPFNGVLRSVEGVRVKRFTTKRPINYPFRRTLSPFLGVPGEIGPLGDSLNTPMQAPNRRRRPVQLGRGSLSGNVNELNLNGTTWRRESGLENPFRTQMLTTSSNDCVLVPFGKRIKPVQSCVRLESPWFERENETSQLSCLRVFFLVILRSAEPE